MARDKNTTKKRIRRSEKAGLIFPVSRIEGRLRKKLHRTRLGSLTSVFLAGVIEYLSAEVLDLSGTIAKQNSKKRITPRHLFLAVAYDQELKETLSSVTIPGAGVVPRFNTKSNKNYSKLKPVSPKKSNPAIKAKKVSKKKSKPRGVDCTIPKATPSSSKVPATVDIDFDFIISKMSESAFKILSEIKLPLGQQLIVVQGDLLATPAEAIINPTNANYFMGGMIGEALKKAGGTEFQKEIDHLIAKYGPLPQAGGSICPISGTLAKHVINCNGPTYNTTNSGQLLATAIKNCLIIAEANDLISLAIPSVGSGRARFPKKLAAEIIIHAIEEYFSKIMTTSLRKIYFVLYDAESIKAYQDEIKNIAGKQKA